MSIFFLVQAILITTIAMAAKDYAIVKMEHLEKGKDVGTMSLQDTEYGLLLTPNLSGIEPGIKGFHVHEYGHCSEKDGVKAGAAGGHFDPDKAEMHLGPYQKGHKGDLPPLYVDEKGEAKTPMLAPRLTVKEVRGHSLMIHKGGDNLADTPHKLGGGGERSVCGVIPQK